MGLLDKIFGQNATRATADGPDSVRGDAGDRDADEVAVERYRSDPGAGDAGAGDMGDPGMGDLGMGDFGGDVGI